MGAGAVVGVLGVVCLTVEFDDCHSDEERANGDDVDRNGPPQLVRGQPEDIGGTPADGTPRPA